MLVVQVSYQFYKKSHIQQDPAFNKQLFKNEFKPVSYTMTRFLC